MQSQFTYFVILAASIAGPLALSFDKKVSFYKKWKYIFPAMLLPALFYIVWDIYFTYKGVWSFNDKYVTGINLGNLPVEEVLFFFVVPYCCMFIYECIRCYFPKLAHRKLADYILKVLGFCLILAGIFYFNREYTSWTFILCGSFILLIYLLKRFIRGFDALSFLVSYIIILIPFLVINGLLTSIPVVLYNNAENLGLRIYTIPFEDCFYGMLLILMNVVIYEKLKTKPV